MICETNQAGFVTRYTHVVVSVTTRKDKNIAARPCVESDGQGTVRTQLVDDSQRGSPVTSIFFIKLGQRICVVEFEDVLGPSTEIRLFDQVGQTFQVSASLGIKKAADLRCKSNGST